MTTENEQGTFSSFWPLCLMAVSLTIILGWQMTAGVQQYLGSLRLVDQQAALGTQAAQAESRLQAMMTDLLQLAKTDAEASAIVTKYRVKMNVDQPEVGLSREALPADASATQAVDAAKQAPAAESPASDK